MWSRHFETNTFLWRWLETTTLWGRSWRNFELQSRKVYKQNTIPVPRRSCWGRLKSSRYSRVDRKEKERNKTEQTEAILDSTNVSFFAVWTCYIDFFRHKFTQKFKEISHFNHCSFPAVDEAKFTFSVTLNPCQHMAKLESAFTYFGRVFTKDCHKEKRSADFKFFGRFVERIKSTTRKNIVHLEKGGNCWLYLSFLPFDIIWWRCKPFYFCTKFGKPSK